MKTVFFIEGLLDVEVVKRVERCHLKTLQEARTATRNQHSVPSGQLRQMHSQPVPWPRRGRMDDRPSPWPRISAAERE